MMSSLNRDNRQVLSLAKNIEVHTSFVSKKSEDLKRKMMLVVDKL